MHRVTLRMEHCKTKQKNLHSTNGEKCKFHNRQRERVSSYDCLVLHLIGLREQRTLSQSTGSFMTLVVRTLILYLFTSTLFWVWKSIFLIAIICLFSWQFGEGQFRGKALPTYVYPDCLKVAIRERLIGDFRDYPNRETSAVGVSYYHAHCYCYYCYEYMQLTVFPASWVFFFVVVLRLKYIGSHSCWIVSSKFL